MSPLNTRVVRRFVRAFAVTPAVAVPLVAAPALAAPPQTWPQEPHVTGFDFLLVLFIIPAGIALLIALLVSIPSMVRGQKYTPGQAWRNESEWFGGPKDGLEAADKTDTAAEAEKERGGASARW